MDHRQARWRFPTQDSWRSAWDRPHTHGVHCGAWTPSHSSLNVMKTLLAIASPPNHVGAYLMR